MKTNPVYSLLGLAAKGRNVVSGEFSVEKAVKEHRAALVIVALDASDNTKKHFTDMCNYRSIPIWIFGDKESLGHAIGNEMRASVAVLDGGLAKSISEKLKQAEASGGNK